MEDIPSLQVVESFMHIKGSYPTAVIHTIFQKSFSSFLIVTVTVSLVLHNTAITFKRIYGIQKSTTGRRPKCHKEVKD